MNKSVFFQRINSVMTDNMYDRDVSGFRSGRIDGRRLNKVAVPGQSRVFKRHVERQNKLYNVCILADQSNSMYGRRIRMLADYTVLLVEGLEKHNIHFALVGFNMARHVHKKFNEPLHGKRRREELRAELISGASPRDYENPNHRMTGGTHTYAAIDMGRRRLLGEREGTNVLILITDGGPNFGNQGAEDCDLMEEINHRHHEHSLDAYAATKWAWIEAQAAGIKTLAVGLDNRRIRTSCPDAFIANTDAEFMAGFLGGLSKLIKRG